MIHSFLRHSWIVGAALLALTACSDDEGITVTDITVPVSVKKQVFRKVKLKEHLEILLELILKMLQMKLLKNFIML